MPGRLLRWVVLLGLLLGGSSIIGQITKAVMSPRPPNYSQIYPISSGTTVTTRDDLIEFEQVSFQKFQPPTPADRATLQAVFTTINEGINSGYYWRLDDFATDRMAEELAALSVYRHHGVTPTHLMIVNDGAALQTAIHKLVSAPQKPLASTSLRLERVAYTVDRNHALALVRHQTRTEGKDHAVYRRWWLHFQSSPGGSRWKVYDFDDPGSHLRFTLHHAGVYDEPTANTGSIPPVNSSRGFSFSFVADVVPEPVSALRRALEAGEHNDLLTLKENLNPIEETTFHPSLVALRITAQGYVALLEGKPKEALELFRQARKHWRDTPMAILGEARASLALQDYDAALKQVRAFQEQAGPTAGSYSLEIQLLIKLKQADAARKVIKRAFEDHPRAIPIYVAWHGLGTPEELQLLGESIAGHPEPAEFFLQVLHELGIAAPGVPGIEHIVRGYRIILPRDELGQVAERVVQWRAESIDALATRLQAELTERTRGDEQQATTLQEWLRMLIPLRLGPAGYEVAFRANITDLNFAPLATGYIEAIPQVPAELRQTLQADLQQMITLHRKVAPKDPWVEILQGDLHRLQGDFAAAAGSYRLALKELPEFPPDFPAGGSRPNQAPTLTADPSERGDRDIVQERYFQMLVQSGTWEKGYAEQADSESLEELGQIFLRARDGKSLLALVAQHRTLTPNEPLLTYWEIVGHDLAGNTDKVMEFFQAGGWPVHDNTSSLERLIEARAYFQQGNLESAEQITLSLQDSGQVRKLRVAIALKQGEPSVARKQFKHLLSQGYSHESLLTDRDIRPILELPEHRVLRSVLAAEHATGQ